MEGTISCHIRYADIYDSKILGYIHSQSWKFAYKTIIPDLILDNISAEAREQYFYKTLSEKLEEDVLILKDNTPVGFMTLGKCRDNDSDSYWGEIWGIYLLPSHWHEGIGTQLINWGINELKARTFKKVSLWVLEENVNARKFYEKLGFQHDGTIKELNIGKALNEYRYIKVLKYD
jgi:RimJ/RimL family protein N-acetyltransferase